MPKEDGYKNLIPMSERTEEERREYGSIGGKKKAENIQRHKTMQECMRALLEITTSKDIAKKKLGEIGEYASDNPTLMELIGLAQLREAQGGNTKAAEFVRDTAGFKPVDRQEITADIMTDSDKALLEKVSRRVGVDPDKLPKE